MNSPEENIKTGVVALVGPPNVGKSTLLNTLLGQKISIVSNKAQTTRNRIMGIVNGEGYQILMLDTPGIHQADSPLNKEMVKIALDSLHDVEIIIFMIDVTYPLPERLKNAQLALEKTDKPVILVINKIDTIDTKTLFPILEAYGALFPFHAMIPISALKANGCDQLIAELLPLLPVRPRQYPDDIPTDVTERFIVGELIREKIFNLTHQEVPYSTAVVIDSFKEETNRVVIHATIQLERDSQKGIIIGKQGKMLARIGREARKDMEELLGTSVLLKLWVKVVKDWSRNTRSLRELGF
ncbi:MAG: GTPase Era [Proteobacteria bacterium]|nr:GTPase Era [Pseudomonadota bacterium]MBU1639301.1 GTPase Era [Pseudomonadota bacterium]